VAEVSFRPSVPTQVEDGLDVEDEVVEDVARLAPYLGALESLLKTAEAAGPLPSPLERFR
jgi:hypothetical protein